MIKKFDRSNLPNVRADIDAALKQVEAKHGIKLGIANISFAADGSQFTTKLTGKVVSETGRPLIPQQEKLLLSELFGIPAEGLESYPIYEKKNGTVWFLTGYNSRAPKAPIQIVDIHGKRAKAPEAWVRMQLVVHTK